MSQSLCVWSKDGLKLQGDMLVDIKCDEDSHQTDYQGLCTCKKQLWPKINVVKRITHIKKQSNHLIARDHKTEDSGQKG
ncbi:hypothetical protein AV530_016601 [Patagioenas fasciata monilis]|uniref:Uncharacterized protein n=1 Tax=Patagioenas fasciata monilis TaxID=372326 RepID=A0A1V4J3D7_PATFA|nr:hypothetical protein AV530_016601 [Patagioenas fasciata monilis]